MSISTRNVIVAMAVALTGCSVDPDLLEPREGATELPEVKRSSVVGGREVSTCAWPSTVRVSGASQCTGTLIHPRVVTTAAHCLSGTSARVTFGGPRDASAFTVTARCRAGARGSAGVSSGNDWGYCVLPEDARIAALPITPPLIGCEAERFLKAGARAWVVGYGTTGPRGQGSGVKREVEVAINKVDRARGILDVGDANVGACHGDSGGPLYVHLLGADGADLGYRVAGSTSGPGARNCDCTCSTTYVDIARHVAEIERNEGIDVTPCTDANGGWSPGPLCRALPSARMQASGTFPSCSVPRTTDAIATCGANEVGVDAGVDTADAGREEDAATDAGGSDAATPRDAGSARDAGAPVRDAAAGRDSGDGKDDEQSGNEGPKRDASSREEEEEEEKADEEEEEEQEPDGDGEEERDEEESEDDESDGLGASDEPPDRARGERGCAASERPSFAEVPFDALLLFVAISSMRRRKSDERGGRGD